MELSGPVRSLGGVTVATSLFQFDDSCARQLPGLSVPWAAAAPAPELLVLNEDLAVELGADPAALRARPGVSLLVGQVPEGVATVAQAYAGHQFGVYVRSPGLTISGPAWRTTPARHPGQRPAHHLLRHLNSLAGAAAPSARATRSSWAGGR